VVERFNLDGSADTTFGPNGTQLVSALAPQDVQGVGSEGVAVQSDAKILIAGQTADKHFGLMRLNPDGSPDATFGVAGLVSASFGGQDGADRVSVDPSTGTIAVFGTTSAGGGQVALAVYNSDGSPLAGFGANGQLTLSDPSTARLFFNVTLLQSSGAVQKGQLVIAATRSNPGSTTGSSSAIRTISLPASSNNGGNNNNSGNGGGPVVQPPTPEQNGLTVSLSSNLPATVAPGQKISGASVQVTCAATGSAVVTLYAWTSDSTGLGTPVLTVKHKLRAGVPTTIRLPRFAMPNTAGSYYLLAGAVLGNASGNSASLGAANVAAPAVDMAISAASSAVLTIKKSSVVFTLTDTGSAPAKGAATLTLSTSSASSQAVAIADGAAVQVASVPLKLNLRPGQSRTQKIRFKAVNLPVGATFLVLRLTDADDTDVINNVTAASLG
jgi:uncharacterized delta-60 repeat protein